MPILKTAGEAAAAQSLPVKGRSKGMWPLDLPCPPENLFSKGRMEWEK